MQEIKCPKCGEVFAVDESGYAQIAKQVRDKEFAQEIKRREMEFESSRKTELELARMKQESAFKKEMDSKEAKLNRQIQEISRLEEKIQQLTEKLQEQAKNKETEKKLAVNEALQEKEAAIQKQNMEILNLKGELKNRDTESQLKEQNLKKEYEVELKRRDELVEYYKDFKARQSTKEVGESLEQYCQNKFNSIRMTAFPAAYFEKDNDVRTGSKGDFIFREESDGIEFISIMFEMKNENDTTATKHKNEHFFKELDKDRREKNCEYAVLVSLLETDNDYYNNGIVDVSYKYEKMYVIRPQFFIEMITLLRNAALNSLGYRRELALVRNQQIDLSHFEENIETFKAGFARNYDLASRKFKTAIEEIDKTIDHLQKTKDALISSENNLRLANNKAEDLTIKKLTKNAPGVKAMFDEQNADIT